MIGRALPPRFSTAARVARIGIDPEEIGNSARNINLPIVGDCKSVLQQWCEAVDARTADRFQPWRQKLADGEAKKRLRAGGNYQTDGDIHPLWLRAERNDAPVAAFGGRILRVVYYDSGSEIRVITLFFDRRATARSRMP